MSDAISRYEQTIQLLERAALRGWDNSHTTFYRFGTTIKRIKSRAHLEAASPRFYEYPDTFQRTFIENVIDFPDGYNPENGETLPAGDNLKVIVTDLFQNSADVALLTMKLRERYLSKRLAIGILGIKSEFAGKVYDVGTRNYTFEYSGFNEPDKFRPFYVLMIGKHLDIERYYEALRASGLDDYPEKNFIVFSAHLANPLPSFDDGKIASADKIVEVGGLLRPGLNDRRVKQFRLRDSNAPASIVASVKNFPLAHTMRFDAGALDSEIVAWKYGSGGMAESDSARRAFTLAGSSYSEKEVTLTVRIESSTLPGDGIYCFKVVLRPKNYRMPEWISKWDMPALEIEKWRQDPKQFNGATTYNLKPFLNDLWGTITQINSPRVGEFYFYIQRGKS